MAIICIQGGSYDPLTDGHLRSAYEGSQEVQADRTILLLSQNPLRDQHGKAPVADRREMAKIRLSFHPEYNFELLAEEEVTNSHFTYDVLMALKDKFPDDKLVWVMGTDNFASLMQWHRHDELLENFTFVVLRRESKPEDVAKEEEFKRTYAHLRRDSAAEALEKGGWYVMNNELIPGRSTNFRDEIKRGVSFSDPADQAISDYAWEHLRDVYGLVVSGDRPKPQFPGLGPV
ncbi:MAG TPA: nicotinate-nicotinamide nucleotide adenylyltransferase [Patescibacteria group bacterium]|jgi:nicotinate-nucleotide adenylyltransferase|nr:nicotinate-nicotinamide nucleotide adenylyltransferase [Patescibacteria group bacterium]